MKNICILGSTGSIGTQALQVVDFLREQFNVVGLVARSNVDLVEQQIERFAPDMVALADEASADLLKTRMKNKRVEVLGGQDGVIRVATMPESDMVLSAIVGIAGLIPTLEAIRAGKDIALANKESLVTAGPIVMRAAAEAGVNIIPVDGEHSAIFQCIAADNGCENLRRLILTASGGPFRNSSMDELRAASPEQALNHPNWEMGRRITIDSATLMNKGFEVIEARWLFDVDVSQISVVIHPESIVHSMVEFIDGSTLAHLSTADMRLQIQLALTHPERRESPVSHLNLADVGRLTFQEPDMERFPCLKYAYEAGKTGGTMPAVVNGADEIAVDAFLKKRIGFLDIPRIIRQAMDAHETILEPDLDNIIAADKWARGFATAESSI
ncbi:1-deoxy-D-xylulose-5-phosphate reductoisomerase [Candidatus Poribacteria bacterium]